jgi:hypothetical protein
MGTGLCVESREFCRYSAPHAKPKSKEEDAAPVVWSGLVWSGLADTGSRNRVFFYTGVLVF